MQRYVIHVFRFFFIFFFSIVFLRFFVISPGIVNGPSMEPTFIDDNVFYVNKLIYLFQTPERYDIVQFIEPDTRKVIIKRVVGLPGEIVSIRRGKISVRSPQEVKSTELSEPYLEEGEYTSILGIAGGHEYLVPSDSYFLVGDNRKSSIDSRVYGPVHRSVIVGRIIHKR